MTKVVNTYDQLVRWKMAGLVKRPVAITVSHTVGCRTQHKDGYDVYSPWEATDPDAHWLRNGKKHFPRDYKNESDDRRTADKNALNNAIDWANSNYGPFTWERNGMGDYVPAELNRKFPLPKRPRARSKKVVDTASTNQ